MDQYSHHIFLNAPNKNRFSDTPLTKAVKKDL